MPLLNKFGKVLYKYSYSQLRRQTWSGTQARFVVDSLRNATTNKMVIGFFDEAEQEVLAVLLAKAEAGYTVATDDAKSVSYK